MKLLNLFSAIALLIVFASCEPVGEYGYDAWDADADEYIIEDEFYNTWGEAGYYDAWDLDDDLYINEEEWETGLTNYYPDYDYDAYGFYDDWDLDDDGLLSEDEFGEGNFGLWDENNDNRIEVAEYDNWYYDI